MMAENTHLTCIGIYLVKGTLFTVQVSVLQEKIVRGNCLNKPMTVMLARYDMIRYVLILQFASLSFDEKNTQIMLLTCKRTLSYSI